MTGLHTQKRFAYHFREMDLFNMPRKRLRIRRGRGLIANDNPASMFPGQQSFKNVGTVHRKSRRIVGVFILAICCS